MTRVKWTYKTTNNKSCMNSLTRTPIRSTKKWWLTIIRLVTSSVAKPIIVVLSSQDISTTSPTIRRTKEAIKDMILKKTLRLRKVLSKKTKRAKWSYRKWDRCIRFHSKFPTWTFVRTWVLLKTFQEFRHRRMTHRSFFSTWWVEGTMSWIANQDPEHRVTTYWNWTIQTGWVVLQKCCSKTKTKKKRMMTP